MKLPQNLYSRLTLITCITLVTGYVLVYAWTTLNPSDADPGKPLTSTLMQAVINNINELNTRLSNFSFSGGNVWIGAMSPVATLDVAGTVKMIGVRTGIALGTVYQAPTDGFVMAFGRADGAAGLLKVSVVGGNANPPTTELGFGYSYNSSAYYWSFQLNVPIQKGEYYRILCNDAVACPSPFFLGLFNAYFVPMGH